MLVVVGAVAAAGVAGFGIVRHQAAEPAPATATTQPGSSEMAAPPPAPPTSSRVQIKTVPPDAEVKIDDGTVTNPLDQEFPRNVVRHHLEISAAGYKPQSQWVAFDADRTLVITLDKELTPPSPHVATHGSIPTPPRPTTRPPPLATHAGSATLPTPKPPEATGSDGKAVYKGTKGSMITEYPQ